MNKNNDYYTVSKDTAILNDEPNVNNKLGKVVHNVFYKFMIANDIIWGLSGFYTICAIAIEANYKTYIMWPIMLGFVLYLICTLLFLIMTVIYAFELNSNNNN